MPKKTPRAAALRILLVDDHELVRRGIRGLLNAQRKWRVVAEATDGHEAVEMAKLHRPDAVVLDIDMPVLNGLEATPRIREAVPGAKIIILTLHESGEMVRRALEAGAHGVVLKSDLAERLVAALTDTYHTRPFLTPKVADIVKRELVVASSARVDTPPSSQKKPTLRETQVIRLLAEGKANKEVADVLGISVRTAEVHRANVMKKFGFRSFADLVRYAVRAGVVPPSARDNAGARA